MKQLTSIQNPSGNSARLGADARTRWGLAVKGNHVGSSKSKNTKKQGTATWGVTYGMIMPDHDDQTEGSADWARWGKTAWRQSRFGISVRDCEERHSQPQRAKSSAQPPLDVNRQEGYRSISHTSVSPRPRPPVCVRSSNTRQRRNKEQKK